MSHNDKVPCPFIMLARQLPMAVAYDTAIQVADRLRKQAKTRAIKLLREVIWDEASGVTKYVSIPLRMRLRGSKRCKRLRQVVDCLRKQAKTRAVKLIKEIITGPSVGVTIELLRGYEGALALADILNGPLMNHAVAFDGGKKYISFRFLLGTGRRSWNQAMDVEIISRSGVLGHSSYLVDQRTRNHTRGECKRKQLRASHDEPAESSRDVQSSTDVFAAKPAMRHMRCALHSSGGITQHRLSQSKRKDCSGSEREPFFRKARAEKEMRMNIDAHPMKENTSISLEGQPSDQKAGDRSKLCQQASKVTRCLLRESENDE
eukprot:748821-Hanusia_phi.AAC.3